jgi:TonB family protein
LVVRTRAIVRKFSLLALPLVVNCLPALGQTTVDAINARLIGQPLYLRGFWMEDDLHFDAAGQPEKKYHGSTFTEAGIDVSQVSLAGGKLHIKGQRMGLTFENLAPKRVKLSAKKYNGEISIEIQSPVDGDFDKALTEIFAADLTSLVPAMPFYWQYYARNHLLASKGQTKPSPETTEAAKPTAPSASGNAILSHGGGIKHPTVTHLEEPQFSDAARLLKYSGIVEVYLWVLPDGTPSQLSIVKPAGLGLDEQALYAVSKYKFKPATKDGKAITVDLYVDVNFQIFQ